MITESSHAENRGSRGGGGKGGGRKCVGGGGAGRGGGGGYRGTAEKGGRGRGRSHGKHEWGHVEVIIILKLIRCPCLELLKKIDDKLHMNLYSTVTLLKNLSNQSNATMSA